MTNADLRKYVQQILSYLKSDFDSYEKARKAGVAIGAGPYLLTASSGIDFLGSLAIPDRKLYKNELKVKGLRNKSTKGSKWYIETYLTKVDPQYGNAGVPNFVYTALRCSQVHEGMVKRGVLIGTRYPEYHLSILEFRESETDATTRTAAYVNTHILAKDFISSTDFFVKGLVNQDQSASKLASRLSDHLQATSDPSQSVNLPRHHLDGDSIEDVYDFSSYNPKEKIPRYTLNSFYWEKL